MGCRGSPVWVLSCPKAGKDNFWPLGDGSGKSEAKDRERMRRLFSSFLLTRIKYLSSLIRRNQKNIRFYMNKVPPIWKRISFTLLFMALVFGVLYLLCLKFGYIPFFQMLLERLSFSLGRRALSFALCKGLGCYGGLTFAILYAVTLTEAPFLGNKMLPGDASSGASTSNQGQSSMGGQIPASTSQPTEVAHRSDPLLTAPDEIKKPLMVDDLRQKELEKRLHFHFIGKSEEIDTLPYSDLVDTQLLIEKKNRDFFTQRWV